MTERFSGVGVSPGAVVGRAVILVQRAQVLRYQIPPARIGRELARLDQSRLRTRQQLVDIREGMARGRAPELAALFDAQLLMLDDPMLIPRAATLVRDKRINAEWALHAISEELDAVFDEVADTYLRDRKGDVADLVGRLHMNLREGLGGRDRFSELEGPSVLIADELPPSQAAQVDWSKVLGFATDAGSRTYHTAILAKSLEVPAVVGLHDASRRIEPGQLVLLDGDAQGIIVNPSPDLVRRIEQQGDERRAARTVEARRSQPAVTADGVRIRLDANIEFPDNLPSARYAGAEGIGLYRSEFLLTASGEAPSEDDQYEVYRRMVEDMAPGSVTVRTFDVEENQLVSQAGAGGPLEPERAGPQGLRGLRLSLVHADLFQTQLRALLRASRHGTLRILFPFVSDVEQVRAARVLVRQAAAAVARRGENVPNVPIGILIEIPAAATIADLLAREVDFFTIGTNDLIQYALAVDRDDARVSQLYQPLHPAVLRMIVQVRRWARRQGVPLSLCGEMASDPVLLTLLVGLGLREFSMTPGAIPVAKQVLTEVRAEELTRLARQLLRLATSNEIERQLAATLGRLSPTRG